MEKRSRGRPGFENPCTVNVSMDASDRDLITQAAKATGQARATFITQASVAKAKRILRDPPITKDDE